MSELLREIQEDMRAQRMQTWWSQFGRTMIWVSVAIVAGTAAGVMWKQYAKSEQAKNTSAVLSGIQQVQQGKLADAIKTFDRLSSNPSSVYWRMAMLHKARAQAESGDKEAAAKTYEQLAKNTSERGDQAFVDLASLEASILSGAPITASKDSPFYYTLSEWRAWQMVKEDKKPEAAKLFAALVSDKETPPSMRERAQLAISYLAPEAGAADAK